jgi:hypothetical protein
MKLIITIIICSLICFFFYYNQKPHYEKTENIQKTTNVVKASAKTSPAIEYNKLSEYENIDKTLKTVAEKWKRIDINGDGLNNCIDAAVLFYQYYPDKSKVCIEINYNSKTGMHHLFNCVFTNGVWKAIEPQAYASNNSNYLMWAIWGNQYDNSYNCDVTSDYIRYVSK